MKKFVGLENIWGTGEDSREIRALGNCHNLGPHQERPLPEGDLLLSEPRGPTDRLLGRLYAREGRDTSRLGFKGAASLPFCWALAPKPLSHHASRFHRNSYFKIWMFK